VVQVREGAALVPLSRYAQVLGQAPWQVQALIPYSVHAGQCHVAGAALDAHGNARGDAYNLGVDGAFEGMTLVVVDATHQVFGAPPRASLQRLGFNVVSYTGFPTPDALATSLGPACQFWLISSNAATIQPAHIDVIRAFSERGRGVYVWGDNDPYNTDANLLLPSLLPGVVLQGNDPGQQYVTPRQDKTLRGYDPHLIFTGIQRLFEGVTIARIVGNHEDLRPLMYSSHGHVVTAVVDDGRRRIVVDGAFTRLYCNWDDAGTSRFVQNAAAWLAGVDGDWL
jgi:hypothetical protein